MMLDKIRGRIFPKYSKWGPLKAYTYGYESFLLMGRINKNNGLISFKSILLYKDASSTLVLNLNDEFNKLIAEL